MKCWLLAPVLILGVSLGMARADYVIIIANLGVPKDDTATTGTAKPGGVNGQVGGAFGQAGGPIGPNLGAGGGGKNPFGAVGGPAGGPAGAGGLPPGGIGGGPRPPFGGAGGGPAGGPAGGFPGGRPPLPGGAAGAAGGSGAFGMMAGGASLFGGLPGLPGGGTPAPGSPLYVTVIVEVDYADERTLKKSKMIRIKHKWGDTILTEDTELTHSIAMAVPTVARRFNHELKKLEGEGDRATIGDWLKMGEHALEFGLLDQFAKVMDRIEQKDKNNPSVVAYLKLKSSFEKEARISADAKTWARKLQGSYKMSYSPHYVVLHTLTDNEGPEVKALKDQLEKNYKAFFYWFALKGKALPIPEYKLVTVMLSQETEFDKKHEIFDPSPLVDDGFFGQRDNLAFFSEKRLDQGYVALTEYTSEVLWKKGYDKEQMLKGKTKIKIPNTRDWADQATIARVHTLALLEKALEEDGRRAAVTHEGTRQLIVSSDLVARGIALPRWIEFGMGSFFETPKSAPWSSTGAPHWIYLAQYKEWVKDKKVKDPTASLKSIVTDKDFLETLKKKNKDKAKPDIDPELKARTLAWSLTYFLAKNRLDELLDYYQELGKLPRDLQFDEKTLLDCFARAFKLVDPTTKKLDEGKLGSLATDWHNYISSTPLEAERLMEEYKKTKKGDSKSGDGKSDGGKSGDDKP